MINLIISLSSIVKFAYTKFSLLPQFLSPSEARRESEKAEVSGTVKDSISVDRFQFKSSHNFVSGLEAAISGSLGKKFTFSEDIRKALTESFERATT